MAFDFETAMPVDKPSKFDFETAVPVDNQSLGDKLISSNKKKREWSDVPSEAVGNIVPSSIGVVEDTVQPFFHPIDTAQAALDLGNAAIQKVLPKSAIDLMYKINPETTKNPEKLLAVGRYFQDRFGSEDAWKESLAKDPVGVAADLMSVLQPTRLIAKGSVPNRVQRVLDVASEFDPTSAPITLLERAAKPVGNFAAATLGKTTGVGDVPIKEAFQAGYEGGEPLEALTRHMRDNADIMEPVDVLTQSLKNMRNKTSQDYQAGMNQIRGNESFQKLFDRYHPLDFIPVEQAARGALNIKKYEGFDKNPNLQSQRDAISDAIQRWKDEQLPTPMQSLRGLPGKDFKNVTGFDALKQGIYELGDWNNPRDPSTMMASNVSNAIKDEIAKQSHDYGWLMRDQAQRIREANDIERTFNLSPAAREETKANKAQGLTRNNVNTSYGLRMDKLRELEPYGAENVLPMLSGQALSPNAPRGIARAGAGMSSIGAYLAGGVPLTMLDLALSSPRIVGEGAIKAGQATRYGKKGLNAIKAGLDAGGIDSKFLMNEMYQLQKAQEAEEKYK